MHKFNFRLSISKKSWEFEDHSLVTLGIVLCGEYQNMIEMSDSYDEKLKPYSCVYRLVKKLAKLNIRLPCTKT